MVPDSTFQVLGNKSLRNVPSFAIDGQTGEKWRTRLVLVKTAHIIASVLPLPELRRACVRSRLVASFSPVCALSLALFLLLLCLAFLSRTGEARETGPIPQSPVAPVLGPSGFHNLTF